MATCYGEETGDDAAQWTEDDGLPPLQSRGHQLTDSCSALLPIFSTLSSSTALQVQLDVLRSPSEYQQAFELMNQVIEEGKTWPFDAPFASMAAYCRYFHSHASFAVTFQDKQTHGTDVLGTFYVKPNFPGRCSHICNGGFITNPKYRQLGVGSLMGAQFKALAKALGYRSSLFNLVFVNNIASVRLWRKLGFTELAVLPQAAVLSGCEGFVDAIQMHCDFYV